MTLALSNAGLFAAICILRRASPWQRWYSMGKIVAGAGLSVRAIASSSGWGHPLLFAIISYCGYAISAACLSMAVARAVRYASGSGTPARGQGSSLAGP